jgi:hypothetical protein
MNETQSNETLYENEMLTERKRPDRPNGYVDVVCYDSGGDIVWEEVNHGFNIVFNDETTYRVGLKGFGIPHPTDSMGSHETWREEIGYVGNERPVFDADNHYAIFQIDTAMQLYGVFITTGSDKGGTSGLMIGIVNFPVVRSVDAGQTLEVTYS